ncbi:MAG: ribonuclease T [Acidobacteria bacterium]|nr:ribonuclease T [Acidobacteriota bacterium]
MMRARPYLLPSIICLLVAIGLTGCNRNPTQSTAAKKPGYNPAPAPPPPAKFDYYVLNMSWEPEFCATHNGAVECREKRGFVLHGLWPQNADGTYPSGCAQEPGLKNPAEFKDLNPDPALLEHEWRKHGTCTGLSARAYFEFTRKAVEKFSFPPIVTTLKHEDAIQTSRILSRFHVVNPLFPAGSIVLSCGNNRLTAVEACLTKDLQPTRCGEHLRSCRAKVIKVTPR